MKPGLTPNLFRLGCYILAILSFTCSRKLDILPSSDIPQDKAIDSYNDLESAMQSMLHAMQSQYTLGGNYKIWPIILSDEVKLNPSASRLEQASVFRRNLFPGDSEIIKTWQWSYRAINRANEIIAFLNAKTLPDSDFDKVKNRYLGEAHFVRGLLYFELVRNFAKPYEPATENDLAVPLRTTPTRGKEFLPRSSIKEVYERVIADFEEAGRLLEPRYLPDTREANTVRGLIPFGRPSGDAARALLARVYFQRGTTDDDQRALSLINRVISEENQPAGDDTTRIGRFCFYPVPYALTCATSYVNIFELAGVGGFRPVGVVCAQESDCPPAVDNAYYETLFQVLNVSENNTSSYITALFSQRRAGLYSTNEPPYAISDSVYFWFEGFETVDARITSDILFLNQLDPANKKLYCNKYGSAGIYANIPVIRTPELLLTRAEIYINTGQLNRAVFELAALLRRANILTFTPAPANPRTRIRNLNYLKRMAREGNAAELLRIVRIERQRELVFEGDRLHYLRSRKLPVYGAETNRPTLEWNSEQLVFPIPTSETSINPLINQ